MTHPTPQGQLSLPEPCAITRALECLVILDARPSPLCRDCADFGPICPNSGLNCDMPKLISDAQAATESLRAEVEALRKDKARLDALQQRFGALNHWIVAVNKDSFTVNLGRRGHATRATLRAAIDAALSQQSGSEVKNG